MRSPFSKVIVYGGWWTGRQSAHVLRVMITCCGDEKDELIIWLCGDAWMDSGRRREVSSCWYMIVVRVMKSATYLSK